MPIIGKVGRKSFKMRALNTSIHLVLFLGAITMIYPFMIMISSSFNSNVDSSEFAAYPKFFFNQNALYKKYIEARLNEESVRLLGRYHNKFMAFDFVELPTNLDQKAYEDWQEFITNNQSNLDSYDYYVSEQYGRGVYPRNDRAFRNQMKAENDKSIELFNQNYDTSFLSWDEVRLEEKSISARNFKAGGNKFLNRYQKFRATLPEWQKTYLNLSGNYVVNELSPAYNGDISTLNQALGTNYLAWSEIILPQLAPKNAMKKHWYQFVRSKLNLNHLQLLDIAEKPYQDFLNGKYEKISLLNQTYKTNYQAFSKIDLPDLSNISGAQSVDVAFYLENLATAEQIMVIGTEYDFREFLSKKYGSIDQLNENYSKEIRAWSELQLTATNPHHNLKLSKDWIYFYGNIAEINHIELQMTSQKDFIEAMKVEIGMENGKLDLVKFNAEFGTNFDKEINVYPTAKLPVNEQYQNVWISFIKNHANPKDITVDHKREQENWQNYLSDKYRDIAKLNHEYHYSYSKFDNVQIDFSQNDYYSFVNNQKTIFWEFVSRNYIMVLDVMLYNGRAITNTIIYCFLAILTAIIVNPLAAYAMSRFKLKATYKIILILMLTMAFPPMVMGIPSFLLLKRLSLLNTFWALILPAAADGYFIFLLKGFFDSLPQELFESATIDGASETRIFWQIAMSLSKPIMAVIALGAFNAAYRNFMFAFIVCQDSSMWTMMVHIYQLMQRSSAGVGFAALVIAAIPTFLVFVFFQNIIIKGIVVPTEK